MNFTNPSQEQIRQILFNTRVIAVVGLSDKPDRTSYRVSQIMQSKGYRIIPVNPNATEILGEKCYASLEEVPEAIDLVNVFRKSELVVPIAEAAVLVQAKVLWLQLGVYNETAAQIALQSGLKVVMDRCIKIEHAKSFDQQLP